MIINQYIYIIRMSRKLQFLKFNDSMYITPLENKYITELNGYQFKKVWMNKINYFGTIKIGLDMSMSNHFGQNDFV